MRYTEGMSPAYRRFLLVEHSVGSAVVNFLLNGVIAWLLFRHLALVPLWGQQSIAGDTIGTTFFLPFITCLIVTPMARRQMRSRNLGALRWSPATYPALAWVPASTFRRGLVFGASCVVAVAPVALVLLVGLGVASMPFWSFVTFKATFAAGLAAVVQPIIAWWAIAASTAD